MEKSMQAYVEEKQIASYSSFANAGWCAVVANHNASKRLHFHINYGSLKRMHCSDLDLIISFHNLVYDSTESARYSKSIWKICNRICFHLSVMKNQFGQ